MGSLTGRSRKRLSQKQLTQRLRTARRQQAARPESRGGGLSGFTTNFPGRFVRSLIPSSRRSRGRSIVGSYSLPWPRSSLWADARSPTCSAFWASWLPDTPVVITGSFCATAGRSRPWHAVMLRRSSHASSRLALFF